MKPYTSESGNKSHHKHPQKSKHVDRMMKKRARRESNKELMDEDVMWGKHPFQIKDESIDEWFEWWESQHW